MIRPFIRATPHHTQIVSFAIIKLFLLLNTRVKTNHIGDTVYALLSMNESMNELNTEYWNSYMNCVIQNIEILGIKPDLVS